MLRFETVTPFSFEPRTTVSETSRRLWNTELEWTAGSVHLVAAPSGSGKTSLCAFLSGRRSDYGGSLYFKGEELGNFGAARWAKIRSSEIVQVYQDLRLLPQLSASENIEIARGCLEKGKAQASRGEIFSWAEELEVAHLLDKKAAALSRGEQQRIAILRSLVPHAAVLLLDEAFSHLDAPRARTAAALISRVAAARNSTIAHFNLEEDSFFAYEERWHL